VQGGALPRNEAGTGVYVPGVHVQVWSAVDPVLPGADVVVGKQLKPQAQLEIVADWPQAARHVVR